MNRRGHHYIIGINLAVQQNPFQPIDPVDEVDADGNSLEETETARRALYEQTMRDQAALVQALTMNPHFRDESPVKISMKSEDAVQHDFGQTRLCSTPVKMVIKNCSWNKHMAYTLEMLSSKDSMVPQKTAASGAGGALDHPSSNAGPGNMAGGAATAAAAILDLTNPHINAHPFFWSGPTFSTGYLEPLAEVELVFMACFTQYGVYDINRWRLAVQVVKALPRKKKRVGSGIIVPGAANGDKKQITDGHTAGRSGSSQSGSNSNSSSSGSSSSSPTLVKTAEEVEEEEAERQAFLPPAAPQGVGKGFMQMPKLAHYVQIS
ncbi:hypothetical protein EDD11_000231 [Mortierella claussenii]|nr:hypothetical protein EDD11_000231 [Mortierella claussenii]